VTGPTSFTVTAPGLATSTYGQNGTTITVTNSGHGLLPGNPVYLVFTTGGAANGEYVVASVPTNNFFTVTAASSATRSGACLFPKWTGGGYTWSSTNVAFNLTLPHGLTAGDRVYVDFTSASSPADGVYDVTAVDSPTRFNIVVTNSVSLRNQNGQRIYPLIAPPLVRSGTVNLRWSTWNLGATDTGATYNLGQSPLSANTVFNFFFPDYAFPGTLSAAGLTTPEFQLTSDTGVALQMNVLASGILNNTGNTNGLSSFTAGDGDIVIDLGPWMTTNLTAGAGVPVLVDNLNSLLLAGQLSDAAKAGIVDYVTNTANFPFSAPPTQTQVRDRVRAVVHLITASPDFTIQK
jgi:hypothetical protein